MQSDSRNVALGRHGAGSHFLKIPFLGGTAVRLLWGLVVSHIAKPHDNLVWSNQDSLRQCLPTGETEKRSLREILADSHISAVAIAVLLLWSLDSGWKERKKGRADAIGCRLFGA